MQEFQSFGAFARHLQRVAAIGPEVTTHITDSCASAIEQHAKARIGHYQDQTGPFEKWALLTVGTEIEKDRLGYRMGAPLLRDGTLRESIGHMTEGNAAAVGSTSDIAVYQELGTTKDGKQHIPPRSFLGAAGFESKEAVATISARTLEAWIAGMSWKRPKVGQLPEVPGLT